MPGNVHVNFMQFSLTPVDRCGNPTGASVSRCAAVRPSLGVKTPSGGLPKADGRKADSRLYFQPTLKTFLPSAGIMRAHIH